MIGMISDLEKLEMIWSARRWARALEGTLYCAEIEGLVRKYIYKDISGDEHLQDRIWLCNIAQIAIGAGCFTIKKKEKQTF